MADAPGTAVLGQTIPQQDKAHPRDHAMDTLGVIFWSMLLDRTKQTQAIGEPDRGEHKRNTKQPQWPPKSRQSRRINLTAQRENCYCIKYTDGESRLQVTPLPTAAVQKQLIYHHRLAADIKLVGMGAPATTQTQDTRYRMARNAEAHWDTSAGALLFARTMQP
ncbi:Hypothetical predicted protein [Pelobates cultripes]|uniref:Uncharacterized protein n=1 Tax=Pelobates cultripes TaxID=61616 RepID=A0AAD1TL57_PELCU|nr:Hypothetical predicted protein [Pelobates cultripes]